MTCYVYLDYKTISAIYGHVKTSDVIERYQAVISTIIPDGKWINKVYTVVVNNMEEAISVAKRITWKVQSGNKNRAVHVPLGGCICLQLEQKCIEYETAINTFRLYSNIPEIYIGGIDDCYVLRPIVNNNLLVTGGFVKRDLSKITAKIYYMIACPKHCERYINILESQTYGDVLLCISSQYPSNLQDIILSSNGTMVIYSVVLEYYKDMIIFDTDVAKFVLWLYVYANSNNTRVVVSYNLHKKLNQDYTYTQDVYRNQVCYLLERKAEKSALVKGDYFQYFGNTPK